MGTFHIIPHELCRIRGSKLTSSEMRHSAVLAGQRLRACGLAGRGRERREQPWYRASPPLLLPLCTVGISLWPAASRGLPGPTSAPSGKPAFLLFEKI